MTATPNQILALIFLLTVLASMGWLEVWRLRRAAKRKDRRQFWLTQVREMIADGHDEESRFAALVAAGASFDEIDQAERDAR